MIQEDDFSFARANMSPDEYVLWKGRPANKPFLSPGEIWTIPFCILWCAFAIFWEYTAITGGAPVFFALFGGVFVCIGLYMSVGRLFHAAFLRKRTYYVITNRKIIRNRNNKIDILMASAMPPAHTTVHKNGSGTIRFGAPSPYYRTNMRGMNNVYSAYNSIFTLENVPNLVQVQNAIDRMEK